MRAASALCSLRRESETRIYSVLRYPEVAAEVSSDRRITHFVLLSSYALPEFFISSQLFGYGIISLDWSQNAKNKIFLITNESLCRGVLGDADDEF